MRIKKFNEAYDQNLEDNKQMAVGQYKLLIAQLIGVARQAKTAHEAAEIIKDHNIWSGEEGKEVVKYLKEIWDNFSTGGKKSSDDIFK